MKPLKYLMAAAVMLAPIAATAGPGGNGGGMGHGSAGGRVSETGTGASTGHGMSMGHTITGSRISTDRTTSAGHDAAMTATTMGRTDKVTAQSQGSTNGVGWDHMNGPSTTGQPGVECEEVTPGRASSAKGSAFNEEGTGHEHYAGEQPQNSRNTASVSQYDIACLNQPQH